MGNITSKDEKNVIREYAERLQINVLRYKFPFAHMCVQELVQEYNNTTTTTTTNNNNNDNNNNNNNNLFVFVLLGWSLLPNALRSFHIYSALPNLGITWM